MKKIPLHRAGAAYKLQALADICQFLPAGSRGLEFGSFAGESAAAFFRTGKFREIHCVDPWGKASNPIYTRRAETIHRDQIEAEFDRRTAGMPVVKHKMTSAQFADLYDSRPFDFGYIDADHSLAHAREDIAIMRAVLAPDGIIAGHDYSAKHPGVVKAVQEAFNVARPDLTFRDSSWLIFLGRIKP